MQAVGEQAGQSSAEAVEASPTRRSPRLERRESHQQVNASTQRGPAIQGVQVNLFAGGRRGEHARAPCVCVCCVGANVCCMCDVRVMCLCAVCVLCDVYVMYV